MLNEKLIEQFVEFFDGVKREIQRKTVPVCFHCGLPYIVDDNHTTESYTTWKPNCACINKTTIRIVTGSV